ncbi:HD domain-containing protein [Planctomycetes bacterium CA13]
MEEPNAIIDQVAEQVSERMSGQQAGHGVDHVLRVLKTAREIQAQVGGDRFVVELAAWLHDVGDAKFHDGVERSAEFAREILRDLDVGNDIIEHVSHIVDNLSFRKGSAAKELSLEGKIVQDADRLDALGAIGIVRTIEFGATRGQPFYVSEANDGSTDSSKAGTGKTGIGHFHEKLFKLRDLLNTEPAKHIAAEREQFMRAFLDQFLRECGEE